MPSSHAKSHPRLRRLHKHTTLDDLSSPLSPSYLKTNTDQGKCVATIREKANGKGKMAKQSRKRGKAKVSPLKLRSIGHKVQSKGGRLASPVRVHNATPVCAPPLILTSPVREKASITPVCDFTMSPVRPQHCPVRPLASPVQLPDSPVQHSSDEDQYQDNDDVNDVLPSHRPHPYS